MPEFISPPLAVVAYMVNGSGEILSVSRKFDLNDLGLPGGGVEPNETLEQAIVREVDEETGVQVTKMNRLFACQHFVTHGKYWAVTFHVTAWEGVPYSREGAAVAWVPYRRLLEPSCSFRAYNQALFDFLKADPPDSREPELEPAPKAG